MIILWDWNTDFKKDSKLVFTNVSLMEGRVKNLKLLYEKVDDNDWQESLGKEPIDKRSKKLRKRRIENQYRLDKQSRRLRLTWD